MEPQVLSPLTICCGLVCYTFMIGFLYWSFLDWARSHEDDSSWSHRDPDWDL